MKKIGWLVVAVIIFAGCVRKAEDKARVDVAEPVQAASFSMDVALTDKTPFSVFIEDESYKLSLYEPKEGVYSGAYILSENNDDIEIEAFEELTAAHGIYIYDMKVGDTFPVRWLLSCLSKMKTPYIVINPRNSYDPFNIDDITTLAQEIGKFYVPVFIDLYPNAGLSAYEPKEYVAFYREAHDIFKTYASNAALVYSVSEESAGASQLFYPGEEYVDWVGINIQKTLAGNVYAKNPYKTIDYIYYCYQKEKPLMLSFAISHLSSSNHVYRTSEAAIELKEFYDTILTAYPRIKAVSYININTIEPNVRAFSNMNRDGNNYSVTDEEEILKVYSALLKSPSFTQALNYQDLGDVNTEYMKSPFKAYMYENQIYIAANSMYYDLKLRGFLSFAPDEIKIENESYYPLSVMEKNNLKRIQTDERNRSVFIKGY